MADPGYGGADMSYTEGDPSFADLIEAAFDEYFRKYDGPMPAEVKTYNAANQTADLQPLFKIYFQDTLVDMPVIRQVPVQWPGGGDGALTFPLAAGDVCGLVPQGIDISNWVASGTKNQAPATRRRFSISDVVAYPRFRPISNPLPVTAYSPLGPVLSGAQVFLGDSTAIDFLIKGTSHNAALASFLGTWQGLLTTWAADPLITPGTQAYIASMLTLLTTFIGQLPGLLSVKVKTV